MAKIISEGMVVKCEEGGQGDFDRLNSGNKAIKERK
jgi:hypothetical protein